MAEASSVAQVVIVAVASASGGFLTSAFWKKAFTKFRTDEECKKCQAKTQEDVEEKIGQIQKSVLELREAVAGLSDACQVISHSCTGADDLRAIVCEIAVRIGIPASDVAKLTRRGK